MPWHVPDGDTGSTLSISSGGSWPTVDDPRYGQWMKDKMERARLRQRLINTNSIVVDGENVRKAWTKVAERPEGIFGKPWEGLNRVVEYYSCHLRAMQVVLVLPPNILDKVPSALSEKFYDVVPSATDDQTVIQLAREDNCPFLSNDDYANWAGSNRVVDNFLKVARTTTHVKFSFSRAGRFVPAIDVGSLVEANLEDVEPGEDDEVDEKEGNQWTDDPWKKWSDDSWKDAQWTDDEWSQWKHHNARNQDDEVDKYEGNQWTDDSGKKWSDDSWMPSQSQREQHNSRIDGWRPQHRLGSLLEADDEDVERNEDDEVDKNEGNQWTDDPWTTWSDESWKDSQLSEDQCSQWEQHNAGVGVWRSRADRSSRASACIEGPQRFVFHVPSLGWGEPKVHIEELREKLLEHQLRVVSYKLGKREMCEQILDLESVPEDQAAVAQDVAPIYLLWLEVEGPAAEIAALRNNRKSVEISQPEGPPLVLKFRQHKKKPCGAGNSGGRLIANARTAGSARGTGTFFEQTTAILEDSSPSSAAGLASSAPGSASASAPQQASSLAVIPRPAVSAPARLQESLTSSLGTTPQTPVLSRRSFERRGRQFEERGVGSRRHRSTSESESVSRSSARSDSARRE